MKGVLTMIANSKSDQLISAGRGKCYTFYIVTVCYYYLLWYCISINSMCVTLPSILL